MAPGQSAACFAACTVMIHFDQLDMPAHCRSPYQAMDKASTAERKLGPSIPNSVQHARDTVVAREVHATKSSTCLQEQRSALL